MSDILDIKDIADRWKVTPDYARRYLTKRPGFPDPAPGSTRKQPRWLSTAVDAFLRGTEENPQPSPQ